MAKKSAKDNIIRERVVKAPKVKVSSDARFAVLKKVSVVSVVLILAICLVFNLLIYLILDKPLTFDTTSVKSNTISEYSKNLLKSLDKKVDIIGLVDENDSIEWKEYFMPLLEDYVAKGDGKVSVRYVDPDTNPFILSELDPDNVYKFEKGQFVFVCEDMKVALNPYSCFSYDQSVYAIYGVQLPVVNNVEMNITGLISYVTSNNPLHAYFLQGHNESESHVYLDTIMQSIGIVTSDLKLSGDSAKIPDDCELLLILQPMFDISVMERELIQTYLDNGGKLVIVNDFGDNQQVDYSNLNMITERMGVTLEQGILHEGDSSYLVNSGDPYTSIAVPSSEYAEYIRIPDRFSVEKIRYMSVFTDKSSDVYVSPLLNTSSLTSVDFLQKEIAGTATTGMYPVVLQCVDTSKAKNSCMIIFGTQDFTSDAYYGVKSLNDNNAKFVRACLGDICQIDVSVSVPAKTIPSFSLTRPISSSSVTFWSIVVMAVIPIGTLAAGIYTYRKRRHL
ncbi:MAG: GldG family protein [Clostridiales bacterium]|nr:GldG family protein [Clostridiales bacterium]